MFCSVFLGTIKTKTTKNGPDPCQKNVKKKSGPAGKNVKTKVQETYGSRNNTPREKHATNTVKKIM